MDDSVRGTTLMIAMHRSRLATAAVGLAALAAASCGGGAGGGPAASATPAPSTTSTSTPAPVTQGTTATPAAAPTTQVSIYLMHNGKVAPAHRGASSTTPARDAILALIAAPTAAEFADGLRTDVPPTTRLLGLVIDNGVATVDLSSEFTAGSSDSLARRSAQVVYTLTQFTSARTVALHVNGKVVASLGGVALAQPVGRAAFERWTPAILIESPADGDTVSSPLHVWGTANTFEAVFHLSLVSDGGTTLLDQVVHASSGTGTRGSFDVTLRFSGGGSGGADLSGYEISMRDGTPVNVATTHVVLVSG